MNISVIIPALNEEATVGEVVRTVLPQASEVLVIDADSTDATATEAARAGATVLNWRDILPDPVWAGKGESLWRGVWAARGDVVVFIDADLTTFAPDIVSRLTAPFCDPNIHMVKAAYTRALNGEPSGGGRVTELTAKPLLKMFFPELSHISQPLGGEYAIRRSTALTMPFVSGYGVEAGLLIDVAKAHGSSSVVEAPCGVRAHRNRPLAQLGPMAEVVASTILSRVEGCGVAGPATRAPHVG